MNLVKFKEHLVGRDKVVPCSECKKETKLYKMYGDLDIFPCTSEEFTEKYYFKECKDEKCSIRTSFRNIITKNY